MIGVGERVGLLGGTPVGIRKCDDYHTYRSVVVLRQFMWHFQTVGAVAEAGSGDFSVWTSNTSGEERDTIYNDSDETGGICMTVQLDSPGIDTQGTASAAAEAELGTLFAQVRELDAQILDVIKRRAELAQRIGAVAKESGASREAQAEEMAVLDRFGELGADGNTLAMTLLRLGRTRRG